MIVNDNKVVFINTLGDLSSVDIETGNLVWQTPTQSSTIYENYFTIKNSDLIVCSIIQFIFLIIKMNFLLLMKIMVLLNGNKI